LQLLRILKNGKLISIILGLLIGFIGIMTYKICIQYNTLWVTILAIFLLVMINYMVAAVVYINETNDYLTNGDFYIFKNGGLSFQYQLYLYHLHYSIIPFSMRVIYTTLF